MRHRVQGRKLGRTIKPRRALMKNLLTSLILNDSIQTTEAKAKELRGLVDSVIVTAKKSNASVAIRRINTQVYSKAASRKIMEILKDKYKDRSSGFTRIHKVGTRPSDGAPYVRIELV